MRVRERCRLAVLTLALLAGCASNPAPRGYLVVAADEVYDARGAWIEVELVGSPGGRSWVEGELLASDGDSLHVLAARSGRVGRGDVLSYSWSQVEDFRARAYDPSTGAYAAITAAGTLSTISHGYYLVLSAPIWMLTGTLMTAAASESADFYPEQGATALAPWARFPQGLPPGVDRRGLTIRPAVDLGELPRRFQQDAEPPSKP